MPHVTIDKEGCKGCELCTLVCPMQVLGMSKRINSKGYFVAEVVHPYRCIGCCICAITCPDMAIETHVHSVRYKLFEY